MELFLRVVFSLAAVLGLMLLLARFATRRMGGTDASVVRLLGRQSLGRTASVAVLAVGERRLVVGVTEGGVRLLTELDAEELETTAVTGTTGARDGEVRVGGPVDTTRPGGAPEPGLVPDGSLLSAKTWRQAWHAATSRGGNDS
jgi:flagellar protein FliO/FliZ